MAEIARILLAERLGMVIDQVEGKLYPVRLQSMPVISCAGRNSLRGPDTVCGPPARGRKFQTQE